MPSKHIVCDKNEVTTEVALSVIAACPNLEQASELLKDQYGIMCSPAKLGVVGNLNATELQTLKERVAPQIEAAAASKMLDVTRLGLAAIETAIARTQERLDDGVCSDPSKVARDIADVSAKMVDKRLALQGRPTQIVENRNTDEIIRSLEALKVATRVDAVSDAVEIPASTG